MTLRMNATLKTGLLTIIAAFMLAIMPLPDWAMPFRPDWVTLVMIYWAMTLPQHVGVIMGWLAGLMLDVSYGTLLGQHAVGVMLVVYVIHMQHQRLRVASLIQQAIVISALLTIKQLILLWVDGMLGRSPAIHIYLLPVLSSSLIWPWLYLILRDLHRKYSPLHNH